MLPVVSEYCSPGDLGKRVDEVRPCRVTAPVLAGLSPTDR